MQQQGLLRALTRSSVAGLFVLGLSLTALAACGSSTSGGTSGGTIYLATDLPVSGTDASDGHPTEYGADLAVQQNSDLGHGYTLKIINKNDEGTSGADPSIGAANIQALLANPQVMAVVGPFNSGVAVAEIPIANKSGLTLISPANTNPGLTLEQYAAARGIIFSQLHPAGKPNYYFRIPANDVVQGKADATIAAGAPINGKKVYVVDDNTTYGKGLADFFSDDFKNGGGTVLGRTSITAAQVSNLTSLATTIINAHPDVVFYGGVTSQGGGALKKDLVSAGFSGPMVGGDGIADDPSWLTTAGSAASNTYGTVAAPDTSTLTSGAAAQFKEAYTQFVQGKPDAELIPYSAQAYDAAMVEITAIKNLINAGKPVTRAAVRDQIAGIHYQGVTGLISFDTNGDNAGTKVFSVYTVGSDNKWAFLKELTF